MDLMMYLDMSVTGLSGLTTFLSTSYTEQILSYNLRNFIELCINFVILNYTDQQATSVSVRFLPEMMTAINRWLDTLAVFLQSCSTVLQSVHTNCSFIKRYGKIRNNVLVYQTFL